MIAPGGQGEVRAVVSFDTLVLAQHQIRVLDQVKPAAEEVSLRDFPGMIGYIVQPGDSLWSIAKKYRMTVDHIRQVNQLKEEVSEGDRLLLVRERSLDRKK